MASNRDEKDAVREEVQQLLAKTPFACSSLSRLSGGTANFVYRGQPDSGKPNSIIIKHTKNYLASNSSFQLDAARCHFEGAILEALHDLNPWEAENVSVKAPRLLHFDREANTQVLEDLPDSVDLKNFLISALSREVSKPTARSLGKALGPLPLKKSLADNKLKGLKHYINYSMLLETIPNFPDILKADASTFARVRDYAAAEPQEDDPNADYGIIHGDFWTGNVLIPNVPPTSQSHTTLLVIDWEMAHVGYRALDLGQMVAELYETKLFKNVEPGLWILDGLLEGYGPLSDKTAFRTAIHVGVHLVCFGSRVAGWGTAQQVEEVVQVGRDLIVHAWNEDKAWFRGHDLACIFQE
ncbi:hypothetical protein N7470_009977 [Penicillium chermesinum]|nr:hypothetical protein N7470_009977 [Penicillium chermesinum]